MPILYMFRKDKKYIRKDDTTTLADSFIKGNETTKSTPICQNPGPSQLTQVTQRHYPIRNQYGNHSRRDTQTFVSQRAIEAPPKKIFSYKKQFSRPLRSQPIQQPKVKNPTLAQVSLPSPIYGLDEVLVF